MIMRLYLVYHDRPEFLKKLPERSRTIAGTYLQEQDINRIKFESHEEWEVYLNLMQKVAIFQRHLGKKMPFIVQERHHELVTLLREQSKHHWGSAKWFEMEEGSIPNVRHRLNMAIHTHDLFPELITDADALLRDLRNRSSTIKAREDE